jgi:hypothetical protein
MFWRIHVLGGIGLMSDKKAEKDSKFKEACPESAKILKKYDGQQNAENKTVSIEDILTSPVYQRGAGYRAEKLKAIWMARLDGMSDNQIRRLLLRGGLTKQTINVMMQDSKEAYEGVNE